MRFYITLLILYLSAVVDTKTLNISWWTHPCGVGTVPRVYSNSSSFSIVNHTLNIAKNLVLHSISDPFLQGNASEYEMFQDESLLMLFTNKTVSKHNFGLIDSY
jgi:hypothetical protein